MSKGGVIVEVVSGKRAGKFGQVPIAKQQLKFAKLLKVWVEYFEDCNCQVPVLENGRKVDGLTSAINIRRIGFYD